MPPLKTVFRGIVAALLVLYGYALGVYNERYFPGDRAEPLPGEAQYWVGLALLMVFASMLVPEPQPAATDTTQKKD